MDGYELVSILPVSGVTNPNWFEMTFKHTDGSLKVTIVESISGLKDVYMAGLQMK